PLRHQIEFRYAADWLHAETEKRDVELVADGDDLADVLGELGARAVHAVAELTAQLDLPARLERDRRLVAAQGHRAPVLLDRPPPVALSQLTQQHLDAPRSGERHRTAVFAAHGDLLVLGAEAPLVARLGAGLE